MGLLACPSCHTGLSSDQRCTSCDFHLFPRAGVLIAGPEPADQRFAEYSHSTGLAQYMAAEAHEHPYYLRFLPEHARIVVDCGGGDANASALWARLHPQARVLVIDMDEWALRKAQSRGLENLSTIRHSTTALPLAGESADVVLSAYMVEHMYDWELSAFYIEARRVLKPGGQLIIQSDAPFFDKYIHPLLRVIRQRQWRTSSFLEKWNADVRAVHHHNLKTARVAREMIERHGFFPMGMEVPLLFSNRRSFAALYEAASGILPMPWIERFLATSYTIVAMKQPPPRT